MLFKSTNTICNKRHPYNETLAVTKSNEVKYPENVRWGIGMNEENTVTITFKDLMNIFTLDLDYSFTKTRGLISYQKIGCPIGGFLSAFYANTVCAYHEWKYLSTLGTDASKVYGIRQMDDLLVWIATKKNNKKTLQKAQNIKKRIL